MHDAYLYDYIFYCFSKQDTNNIQNVFIKQLNDIYKNISYYVIFYNIYEKNIMVKYNIIFN